MVRIRVNRGRRGDVGSLDSISSVAISACVLY